MISFLGTEKAVNDRDMGFALGQKRGGATSLPCRERKRTGFPWMGKGAAKAGSDSRSNGPKGPHVVSAL